MSKARRLLLLNGPNLNMLGTREPDLYGRLTLADIVARAQQKAQKLGFTLDAQQSNIEGDLVGWIQKAPETYQGIAINGGGYSHTSIAIADALRLAGLPTVEVHLTNVYRREQYRHHSHIAEVATGTLCGFGAIGYELAVEALAHLIGNS